MIINQIQEKKERKKERTLFQAITRCPEAAEHMHQIIVERERERIYLQEFDTILLVKFFIFLSEGRSKQSLQNMIYLIPIGYVS